MGKAKAAKTARRETRARWDDVQLWHGGLGGLAIGDKLVAPIDQNIDDPMGTVQYMSEVRADRVYFTTDRELARVFASAVLRGRGSGALCRVRPIGPVLKDPDFPTVGLHSRSAQILEVVEQGVALSPHEEHQRQAPYLTWADGRAIYDSDGHVQVTWKMEQRGITQQHLDAWFPQWTRPQEVLDRITAKMRTR